MSRIKLKIKKGDTVVVTTGSEKGKTGEVLRVLPSEGRVVIKGIKLLTKHKKPTQGSAGGIEKVEGSIAISNVAIKDPKTGKPSRVGYKTSKDGKKVRIAKKSGEELK